MWAGTWLGEGPRSTIGLPSGRHDRDFDEEFVDGAAASPRLNIFRIQWRASTGQWPDEPPSAPDFIDELAARASRAPANCRFPANQWKSLLDIQVREDIRRAHAQEDQEKKGQKSKVKYYRVPGASYWVVRFSEFLGRGE
jgi:hypothetical protein